MTISFDWLKTLFPTNLPAAEVAALLTGSGLEVEGLEELESIPGGLRGVVLGTVLTCERHPDADIDLPLDIYLPATATASGKILYAHADLQPQTFAALTESSITTPDEWRTEVARVRRRGYAYSIEEWIPGQCTLGVPYRHTGSVVAAIGVQMSAGRYLREERNVRERVLDIVRESDGLA